MARGAAKALHCDGEAVTLGPCDEGQFVKRQGNKLVGADIEGGSGGAAWGGITGTLSDQTDLQGELDGKEDAGTAASAVSAHEAEGDPHTGYLTAAEADAAYEEVGAVATHEALADPHPGYLTPAEGNAAYEAKNANIQAHVIAAHAPANAQKNSDITKAEIEAVLTGELSSHSHAGGSGSGPTKISGTSGAFSGDTTWITITSNSADVTSTTQTTVATITGLAAGTYRVKGALVFQAAATTTGIGITLNHTGTVSRFVSNWIHITTGGAAATGVSDQSAATAAGQMVEGKAERAKDTRSSFTVGVDTQNADELAVIDALLVVTVSGDLQLKIATEVSGSAVRLMAGSSLEVNKLV